MDREKLEALLGLKPTAAPKGWAAGKITTGAALPTGAGAHALVLDRWDRAQGERLEKDSPAAKATGLGPAALADFHACAFLLKPELSEGCEDRRRWEYVKALVESPDLKALRASTVANTMAADMAAVTLAQGFAALKRDDNARKARQRGKKAPGQQAREDEAAAVLAASRALQKAQDQQEEAEETEAALGCGAGQGEGGQIGHDRLLRAFDRVRNSAHLRRVIELAGRYRRVAQSRQRTKVRHGYDDVVGVEMGGDVGRLLPHELAKLAEPEFELDALRRLVERQSMCREFRGKEQTGRGPVVVVVDESASMAGEPIAHAKAFALALAWVARHQRRWCCLVGFSSGPHCASVVLKPDQPNEQGLLNWLNHFYNGGTDLSVLTGTLPLMLWPQIGAPKGKTDIIVVTDGIMHCYPEQAETFLKFKREEKVRVQSLILGQPSAGGLAGLSDEVFFVPCLQPDGEQVGAALSL